MLAEEDSMVRYKKALSTGIVITILGWGSVSMAQKEPNAKLNQCWGQVASQLAKLDTPKGTHGGPMGQHSRSTKAADINGGFASDGNGFGITFNVKEDGENAGRSGVGNVSKSAPHGVHPGEGGNGIHAINNSNNDGLGFANTLDPVSGEFVSDGKTNGNLDCDLVP